MKADMASGTVRGDGPGRLSGRPFRSAVVRALLLFGASFALFFCLLWVHARVWAELSRLAELAQEHGIVLEGLVREGPALRATAVHIPLPWGGRVSLAPVRASLNLLPPEVRLTGRVAGGDIRLVLAPDRLWRPWPLHVSGQVEGASLPDLLAPVGIPAPAEVHAGQLHLSGMVELLPKGGVTVKNGTLTAMLEGGRLVHHLPVLRTPTVDGLAGEARLHLADNVLRVEHCRLHTQDMDFSCRGQITLGRPPASSRLSVDTSLRVPAARLEKGLIPPRIMEQFRRQGRVNVTIDGTLGMPSFHVGDESRAGFGPDVFR